MGIKFGNVSFEYQSFTTDKFTLHDIDLTIEAEGEFIAIVGHTGSGKSTLIQHMNALLTPSGGEVEVFGISAQAEKVTPIRQKVGMVFQFPEYQLFEETVKRDIAFGPTNFGVSKEDAEEIAREVISEVGLSEDLLERSPFTLSGGQMRRVAIAGILAMKPEILVLDEPTVGLDPQGQREMMQLFKSLHESTNKTTILVTHNMDVVSEYCTRVIVMKKGRKVYDGAPVALFSNDALLEEYNLEVPQYMRITRKLNEKLGLKLNPNVSGLNEALEELSKLGD